MDNSAIRGIIFDLDGVLLHSKPAHSHAFNHVFRGVGIDDFEYAPYAGRRTADVIVDVLNRRGRDWSPNEVARLSSEKSRLARQILEANPAISKQFDAVIPRLAARYRLGLASSGARASVDAFLKASGSRSMFRSILSGDDVADAKPHPEIYRRSLDAIGLKAQECLVVEDAIAGVEAARAAGIAVVGVAGICSDGELRNAGVCHVVTDLGDLDALLGVEAVSIDRPCWTAVIPAAGRGSRLGYSRPKILFPLGGRLVLDWLLELLATNCERLVFVLSPDGAADVTAELERRIPKQYDVDYKVVIQQTPTGMGDAVAIALPAVRTRNVAVLWGDQVALRRASAEACMGVHQGVLQPELTFPTVMRADPYICFERDAAGRLIELKQAREGAVMPTSGESDGGFFCFSTARLSALLAQLRASGDSAAVGSVTGEFNLLPVIPLAAKAGLVPTPRLSCAEEAMGINDSRDAAAAEEFLVGLNGR